MAHTPPAGRGRVVGPQTYRTSFRASMKSWATSQAEGGDHTADLTPPDGAAVGAVVENPARRPAAVRNAVNRPAAVSVPLKKTPEMTAAGAPAPAAAAGVGDSVTRPGRGTWRMTVPFR